MSLGTRASVWATAGLVWSFAERDLKSKVPRNPVRMGMGAALPWPPCSIYTVVFSVVFRAEPPPFGNGKPGNYAVWLLVVWSPGHSSRWPSVPGIPEPAGGAAEGLHPQCHPGGGLGHRHRLGRP